MKLTSALLFLISSLQVSPAFGLPQPVGDVLSAIEARKPPQKPIDQLPIPPDPCNSADPPSSCPESTIHPTPPPSPPDESDECNTDDPPPYCDEISRKRAGGGDRVRRRDPTEDGGGSHKDNGRANQTPSKGAPNPASGSKRVRRDAMERANRVAKEGGTNLDGRSVEVSDSKLAARAAPEGLPYKEALDAGQGGYLRKRKSISLEQPRSAGTTGGHFSGETAGPRWNRRRGTPSQMSKVIKGNADFRLAARSAEDPPPDHGVCVTCAKERSVPVGNI